MRFPDLGSVGFVFVSRGSLLCWIPRWLWSVCVLLVCTAGHSMAADMQAQVTAALDQPQDLPVVKYSQTLSGPYRQAFELVLARANVKAVPVHMPLMRERRMFVEGDITAECCLIPAWRTRPDEMAVQVFSDPIYMEKGVTVALKTRADEIRSMPRSALRTAVIRGYVYTDLDDYGTRLDADDFDALFTLLKRRRADVAFIGYPEYLRLQRTFSNQLAVIHVVHEYDLSIRVHRDRPEVLAAINKAIAELRAEGAITAILEPVS